MAKISGMNEETKKDLRDMVRNAFDLSYVYIQHDYNGNGSAFARAQRSAMAYERVFDMNLWQPQSEIYFPHAKIAVDLMLFTAMDYIFGDEDFFSLIPSDDSIDYGSAANVADAVKYEMNTNMNCFMKSLPAIKDAIKLGVGYSVVDVIWENPWKWTAMEQINEDEKVDFKMLKQSDLNKLKPKLRQKYVPFARILPSPGGSPDVQERNWIIHTDFVSEMEFRNMFAASDSPFTGDVDKIIAETKKNHYEGGASQLMSLYSNWSRSSSTFESVNLAQSVQNTTEHELPAFIPIMKYYGQNMQTWLANGETPILYFENEVQSIRKPIIKATIDVDGEDWFTDGLISANEDMFMASNIMSNTIIDWVSMLSKPAFLVDKNQVHGDLKLEPWAETPVYGPVRDVVKPIDYPPISPEVMQMNENIRQISNLGTGHSDALQGQGGVGIVRGGVGALESLLQTAGQRDKFASAILDMGYVKDLIEQCLMVMQYSVSYGQDYQFQKRKTTDKGASYYENLTISSDILRNNFRVSVDMKERMKDTVVDRQLNQALYQMLYQMPVLAQKLNPENVLKLLIHNRKDYEFVTAGDSQEEYQMALAFIAMLGEGKSNNRQGATGASGQGGRTAPENTQQQAGTAAPEPTA